MAISLIDNLDIKKKSPDVARQLFDTVSDMVAFSENYLPAVYECNVIDTGKRYRYMVTNTVDPVLGKWREVTSTTSISIPVFLTKSAMKAHDEIVDKMAISLCFEDKGLYIYSEDNTIDESTGKWRLSGSIQTDDMISEEELNAIAGNEPVAITIDDSVLIDADGNILTINS